MSRMSKFLMEVVPVIVMSPRYARRNVRQGMEPPEAAARGLMTACLLFIPGAILVSLLLIIVPTDIGAIGHPRAWLGVAVINLLVAYPAWSCLHGGWVHANYVPALQTPHQARQANTFHIIAMAVAVWVVLIGSFLVVHQVEGQPTHCLQAAIDIQNHVPCPPTTTPR